MVPMHTDRQTDMQTEHSQTQNSIYKSKFFSKKDMITPDDIAIELPEKTSKVKYSNQILCLEMDNVLPAPDNADINAKSRTPQISSSERDQVC